jgi:hypothetical protein
MKNTALVMITNELPPGGFRGEKDNELPTGGFRGDDELPTGGFRT